MGAGPLVRWSGWVKAGILAGLTKMQSDTFAVIAAHEGTDGSFPSAPTISELTGHSVCRLYAVLGRLVTLGVIERTGSVRRAGSRGRAVVVYRITKPVAQSKVIPTGKPIAEGKVTEGKTCRSETNKHVAQSTENLSLSDRRSVMKCKEVGANSAAPPQTAALAPPGNGGDPLRELRMFFDAIDGDTKTFAFLCRKSGYSEDAIAAVLAEHAGVPAEGEAPWT
jgi:hypothetical protein